MTPTLLYQQEEWDHDLPSRNLLSDLGMGWGFLNLDTPIWEASPLFLRGANCHTPCSPHMALVLGEARISSFLLLDSVIKV